MATTKKTTSRRKATTKAPSFNSLSAEKQREFTSKIVRAVKALASVGARYKVVSVGSQELRDRGIAENRNEDQILTASDRAKMLDLARNQVRNSPTLNSILKQFDLQGVGTVGGKATFVFDDVEKSRKLREAFAEWTRSADFFDGLSFNTLLKVILKTYIIGGDVVILFDDGLIEDSGRVVVYEPDEIGDISATDLADIYGANAYQSIGRVKNGNGRFIGVVVSRSQRGATTFDVSKCYTLHCDPNASILESPWIMPRNVWRKDQGRGISPMAPAIATIEDLEDLTTYELQSAKKNAQTLAQVIQSKEETVDVPSAFDAGTDFSSMTDAEINAAVAAEGAMETEVVTLDQIKGAGAIYEVMPEGKKLELLDTKHPNPNMPEFIRWLAGRSAAPFGLGSVYATLKADQSYTSFRGEQVMSQPAFEEAQKFLEGICDWVLARWSKWALRKGIIDSSSLPDGWLRHTSWQWPKMREVNQVDEQNAISMKLKNGTGSYAEIYGADWREKLTHIGKELEFCKEHGIPHPALITPSGAVIDNEGGEIKQEGNR